MAEPAAEAAAALAALDRALAARPGKDDAALADTTAGLVALRDRLIGETRADGARPAALDRVNGCLTAVLSGHYPIGAVPWATLEAARAALAELVATFRG